MIFLIILPWWVSAFWDWFWYFRRGKVKYRVWNHGDTWKAMAATKDMAICNRYGGTREQALEMARVRLQLALNKVEKDNELVIKGDGFALYREKK